MIEDGGINTEEFKSRIQKCISAMKGSGTDLMYVYGDAQHPENLIYLTNFRPIGTDMPGHGGYNAVFLLFKNGEMVLVIDREWYVDHARKESFIEEVVADSQGDTLSLSIAIAKNRLPRGKIELDSSFMPASAYKTFMTEMSYYDIDEKAHIANKLREIKSPKEIELVSRGLEILGKAHEAALRAGKEGVREVDIAQEIRMTIMNEGADCATSMMVLAGRRSCIPLGVPMNTNYKLRSGDMVSVSIFCVYKKYSAGMDRNWVVGEPSEKQRKLAAIELKGLEKAISLVRPGMKAADFMNPVYFDYIEPMLKEAGILDYYIQGYVGHGTGLATYETPVLWKLDDAVLRPGMVIDMEPGIYSKEPQVGGIRTADLVVVTENGCKGLTKFPRRIGSLILTGQY